MKKGWKAGWIIAGVAAVTGGMFCIAYYRAGCLTTSAHQTVRYLYGMFFFMT